MSDYNLLWPSAYRPVAITHPFGEKRDYALGYHEGMDLRAPTGTEVYAAMDGVVDIVATGKMYGNQVWLRHDLESDMVQTVYAHLQKFAPSLKRGQRVKRGELLGYADSTGNSQGAHLHFGLRVDGKWIDPQPHLVVPA
jgi:murein DD-endopeptidase MepM/ murein hydrolase activator NlpD